MMGGGVNDSPSSVPTSSLLKRGKKKKNKSKKSKKAKKANKTKRRSDQHDENSHHEQSRDSPPTEKKKQPKIEDEGQDTTGLNTAKTVLEAETNLGVTSSWGDVFALASSVEPLSLGDDFTQDEETGSAAVPYGGGNIGMISQIALQYLEGVESTKTVVEGATNDETIPVNDDVNIATKKMRRGTKRDNDDNENDDNKHTVRKEETLKDSMPSKSSPKKKRKKEKKNKKSTIQSSDILSSDTQGTCVTNDLDLPVDDHFPFPTDPDDHCESPAVAYEDILPILEKLALLNNAKKGNSKLQIYDPYYCDGSVVSNLSKLGFDNVYNNKEDCYKTWDKSDTTQPYPACDVLVTNPPYSGNHVERLMKHVSTELPTTDLHETAAWCLLMPTYVHKKNYFLDMVKKGSCQPFYLVPKKRYVYIPPKNFRAKKESDVHKKSSPFVSMWYIWGGSTTKNKELMNSFRAYEHSSSCELARSKSSLRDLRRKK